MSTRSRSRSGAYPIVFDGRAEGGTVRCFDRKEGGP